MTSEYIQLLAHLEQFISENRKKTIERILDQRTRRVTVVLEDIFQSQNASAVIRTCECMGIQDIHIIEQRSKYHLNPRVLKGSNKWMTFRQYNTKGNNNTQDCFDALRRDGYRILVTDPAEDGVSIHDVDFNAGKIAIVFGNELRGISSFGIDYADQKVKIPMYGFTESLNISVSVAICLNSLIERLRKANEVFTLSEDEKSELKLDWYRKIVRRSDLIEKEFLRTNE
jgi:tRNA (guanosine-2'-O-)-methyltransferase